MRSCKLTDQQIVFALKQAETGSPAKEVIHKMGAADKPSLVEKEIHLTYAQQGGNHFTKRESTELD